MRSRRQKLLVAFLGLAILGAALATEAALIFDGLSRHYTIQILRQGRVVTSVAVPPDATLEIDAKSVSHDKDNKTSTFHGNVTAKAKLADIVLFSISSDEMRLVSAN